ncbi:MAG: bifunctional diaminohydroxyphosphoribosylaminopyrimidine deaminase/5-amino-6-(5-phosphoribosylamino)uracil reductase RibD [Phycisphaerales bacterium]|nr:MAG: bifunctional diaminohydroxyphosphoribosylaminopyrimidine deaminase/5-amino-6-(5-phosphoribosylamino)uracil reductase RibD [Phycisphaerales bacterium]
MTTSRAQDLKYLHRAARLALRGHGGSEPNPLVGCLVVSPRHEIVGWGYHRRCGEAHAEIHALQRAGSRAAGATAYITLEPCNHHGRTPPCTGELIKAGVARVVIARRDPNPIAAGGIERLREGGIEVVIVDDCDPAMCITDGFARRVRSGLPWIIAKWAQTLDGRVATRSGESRWISNEASRRLVHRQRGRVDVILTGIGTVLADDPLLTARNVRTRRIARRVVVDPQLQTPPEAKLVTTADRFPTTIACLEAGLADRAEVAGELRAAGVEIIGIAQQQDEPGQLPLAPLLRMLVERYEASNVLVEAGPGLLSRLFRQRLVNDALVFIAPLILGDDEAEPCVTGRTVEQLTDGLPMRLLNTRRRGDDLIAHYRVK